jgi:glycosyltransferase involved in cell wall biosynthesis
MSSVKKVLMISYTSFIQKFYQTLPHEIARQTNWQVKVLVPPYWKELWSGGKKHLEKNNDELYELFVGNIWFPGNLHFAMFKSHLKLLLKNFHPDIIDLEDEPFNLGSFQIVRYRNRYSPKSKIVLHASQHQFKHYPPPFNFTEKYVLKNIDGVLVRNKMAENILRKKGFKSLVKIVTHGVNTDAFHPGNLPELDRQLNLNNKPVIGFVGALEEHKGVQHLIQALAGLHCSLLLVGEGSYKSELQKLAKENKIDVNFLSNSTHEEVAQYMNCMNIFVLPSLTMHNWVEKFGRVLIEAMASGIPIIGSSSGEIANVIGEAGIIFQESDINDLRNKLQMLLDNPKMRNELGAKSRKRVEENYSWQKIAARTIDVYKQILIH